MRKKRTKWICEIIKKQINEIPEKEVDEKLARIWELLQSLERQPAKSFRPENPMNEFVGDPVKNRRSA